MRVFLIFTMTLVTLACADVSHLGHYNYHAPEPARATNFATPKYHLQSQFPVKIESIKASVPIAGFSIHQNNVQRQNLDAPSLYGSQAPHVHNHKHDVHHHHIHSVYPPNTNLSPPALKLQQQQQQYTTGASAAHPLYSAPASGPVQSPYLPPLPQQQQFEHQHLAPVSLNQHSVSPPVPAPAAVVPENYYVPTQQSYSGSGLGEQHTHNSAGQTQQQSYAFFEQQQQQLVGGVETAHNDGNNYHSHVHQPNFYPATPTVQQSYSAPVAAPAVSVDVDSQSHNHQVVAPLQQQYPTPVHQSASTSGAVNYYHPAAPIQRSYAAVAPALAPPKQNFHSQAVVSSAPVTLPKIPTAYSRTGGYVYYRQ